MLSKRAWYLSGMAVVLLIVGVAFVPSEQGHATVAVGGERASIVDRIASARDHLEALATTTPNASIHAAISLAEYLQPEEALQLANRYGLQVWAMRFHIDVPGHIDFHGGAVFRQGATQSLVQEWRRWVRRHIEDADEHARRMIARSSEPEAAQRLLERVLVRQAAFRQGGIPIYGLRVVGTPQQLLDMWQNSRLVTVVEQQDPYDTKSVIPIRPKGEGN